MKKQFVLLTCFLVCLLNFASTAQAEKIGDATALRKLSLALKGLPPSQSEYKTLQSLPDANARKNYLTKMVQTYLASKEYQDRMVFRLSERFQIRAPMLGGSKFDQLSAEKKAQYSYSMAGPDSLTDLFARIAKNNLSWDELLTAKTYTVFPKDPAAYSNKVSDAGFFGLLNQSLPWEGKGAVSPDFATRPVSKDQAPIQISFTPDDSRVAGALTTARFASRYTTTGINKNRRRAAAVFRTFLCDPMVPAISTDGDRTHDFHDVAFNINYEVTEEEIKNAVTISSEARHGSDPQCVACHYKLDPMGHTFQAMGVALNTTPAAGALIYKTSSPNKVVNVPVNGIGELGAAITQQQEYVDCQVSWLWTEFIGNDVRLTSSRKAELSKAFNQVGRRTNDFIALLVTQPEFYEKPKSLEALVTFDLVKPLFKRCDNCHSHLGDVPDFAKLPFSFTNDPQDHATWIAEITDRVNRPEGARGRMPKDASSWKTTELELIKKWLSQGAPDENGKATVEVRNASAQRTPQSVGGANRYDISFNQSWSRYPSPDTILQTLQAQFPLAKPIDIDDKCSLVTSENRDILGTANPLTGEATIKDPNSAFLVWYTGCVVQYARSQRNVLGEALATYSPADKKKLAPLDLVRICEKQTANRCTYSDLSETEKMSLIQTEIEKMVGPDEVVAALEIAPSTSELAKRIAKQVDDIVTKNPEALTPLKISIPNGTLSLVDGLMLIDFLILLNDTLKH